MISLPGALVAAFCALPQHSLAPWHTAPRAYQGNIPITTCILQITTEYSLSLSLSLSYLSISFLLSLSCPSLSHSFLLLSLSLSRAVKQVVEIAGNVILTQLLHSHAHREQPSTCAPLKQTCRQSAVVLAGLRIGRAARYAAPEVLVLKHLTLGPKISNLYKQVLRGRW